MTTLRNERGIALVSSLLITMLGLAVVLSLLYYISASIQHSAATRRYHNVRESAAGGAELFTKELIPLIFEGKTAAQLITAYPTINLSFNGYSTCLKNKITNSTANWNGALCAAGSTVNDPKVAPDVTFKLNGLPLQPKFNVFAKVVDTAMGNSDASGFGSDQLDTGGGVVYGGGGGGAISPMHIPALITVEIQGERENNAKEKAKLSVLYAY